MPLILYQRDDCHLCDLALDVLAARARRRSTACSSMMTGAGGALRRARAGAAQDATGAELDGRSTRKPGIPATDAG